MTVTPRIPSRSPKSRRSSFVAPANRSSVVPDALSWLDRREVSRAPKGPAAWMAASSTQADRTIIDAGPYGVIDLAVMDPRTDLWGRDPQVGVVWWDKNSFREEDDDFGTIQTSFVPAPNDHGYPAAIAAAPPAVIPMRVTVTEPSAETSPVAPRHARHHASLPGSEPEPPPKAEPELRPEPVPDTPADPPATVPPVPASRPAAPDDVTRTRHARRSRHTALVPPVRGRRRRTMDAAHPRRALLRRRRGRRRIVLGAVLVVIAFGVTILVQSALLTPFTVPSVSMENTLHIDDRILVNKLAYASSSIRRGDVVVFTDPGGWLNGSQQTYPDETDGFLVKRVIGLPGDHVSCCATNGHVTVNGAELLEPYAVVPHGQPAASSSFDVTVPAGALWVLGDNRYNSRDSSQTQGLGTKGFVPIADVVGQAALKLWPLTQFAPIGSAHETFASVRDQTCPI